MKPEGIRPCSIPGSVDPASASAREGANGAKQWGTFPLIPFRDSDSWTNKKGNDHRHSPFSSTAGGDIHSNPEISLSRIPKR